MRLSGSVAPLQSVGRQCLSVGLESCVLTSLRLVVSPALPRVVAYRVPWVRVIALLARVSLWYGCIAMSLRLLTARFAEVITCSMWLTLLLKNLTCMGAVVRVGKMLMVLLRTRKAFGLLILFGLVHFRFMSRGFMLLKGILLFMVNAESV